MSYDIPPDIKGIVPLHKLWRETHENKMNQIVLINGLPRKGKSEIGLNFAYHLYRGTGKDFEHKFDVAKHVDFTKLDHQKALRKYTTVGACLQWEEAGVAELGASAREFWSGGNKSLSTLFQTMGFRRQIDFITLPSKVMLDKHLRMLAHVEIEAYKVKPAKRRCFARIRWNEPSSREDKVYSKYPRYIEDGLKKRIKTISVPRAPEEIRREYVARSEVFKKWLQDKLVGDEEKRLTKTGKKSAVVRLKQKFNKIKQAGNYREYWDEKKKNFDVHSIIMLEDISRHHAYMLRKWLTKEFVDKEGNLK